MNRQGSRTIGPRQQGKCVRNASEVLRAACNHLNSTMLTLSGPVAPLAMAQVARAPLSPEARAIRFVRSDRA